LADDGRRIGRVVAPHLVLRRARWCLEDPRIVLGARAAEVRHLSLPFRSPVPCPSGRRYQGRVRWGNGRRSTAVRLPSGGVQRRGRRQEGREGLGTEGSGEQVALAQLGAEPDESIELLLGLDAF